MRLWECGREGRFERHGKWHWASGDGSSEGSYQMVLKMSSLEGQENGGTVNKNRQVMTAFLFSWKGCVCVCVYFQNQLLGEGPSLRTWQASRWKCPAGPWTCEPGAEEKPGGLAALDFRHPQRAEPDPRQWIRPLGDTRTERGRSGASMTQRPGNGRCS